MLPVDVEQCYRLVICFTFFFYSLLLGIYGLLGNVVTLTKKKKQTNKQNGEDSSMVIEGMRPPVKFMINFRQISANFQPIFPNFQKNLSGHQSNFPLNFSREFFPVKQKFTTNFFFKFD